MTIFAIIEHNDRRFKTMTLHVSLPKELEALVHLEVQTGMYGSASEVVREALRGFFGGSVERELRD